MICPDSNLDCDNPGCRRGGCQGRRPSLPLFRANAPAAAKTRSLLDAALDQRAAAITRSDRPLHDGRLDRLAAA
ncbi:MAG: hypothetical protein AB7H71_09535 [Alphaproteobacteria bacterium]